MHFLVFDSRPSALFFSTSILSDRTSRPGVYQLIAHPAPGCHCEPMRFFFFFTPTFSKWVTHVFHRVPLIEENNYSQPKLSPVFFVSSVVTAMCWYARRQVPETTCKPAHLSLSFTVSERVLCRGMTPWRERPCLEFKFVYPQLKIPPGVSRGKSLNY